MSGDEARETATLPTQVSVGEVPLDAAAPIVSTLCLDALRGQPLGIRQAKLALAAPSVISLAIKPPVIETRGFLIPRGEPLTQLAQAGAPTAPPRIMAQPEGDRVRDANDAQSAGESLKRRRPSGRIAPPRDLIRLEDRLMCLLEPPVESWMRQSELTFAQKPFPHQWDGVAFLFPRHQAILADEMGLGKTMQAITAIRLLLHAGKLRSVLLICPKPLVTNWQREFARWAPEIPVTVVEGAADRRAWRWSSPLAVKIANYELLHRDAVLVGPRRAPFDLVILDEAQRIKNRESTISRLVRDIPRKRSWALTGTPVENSPNDLVGIFEFLSPGYLQEGMQLAKIGSLAADHVLRRTKSDVQIDLPPKLFRDLDLPLSPEQEASYRLAEEEGVIRLSEMGDEITIQHVFELVLRLKQICNFDPATGASCKLERLTADLEEIAGSGQKAIVFSQWVETLTRLSEKLAPYGPLEYHGRIPSPKRDAILREFRSNPQRHVLLMSYGAGGVGLNLQFTQYVFLFDRWWNPAVEDQAINRAHRIGAESPVTVGRFLTLGTIEERIDEILQAKRDLFDAVLSHARGTDDLGLSREEIFGLFEFKPRPRRRAA